MSRKVIAANQQTANAIRRMIHSPLYANTRAPGKITATGGSGNSYNGYFKVKKVTETSGETTTYKIKIVDGLDEEAANCGVAVIDEQYFDIPFQEITVTATCFIYIQAVLNVSDPNNPYIETPTVEVNTNSPSYESNKGKYLLSRVVFKSDKLINASQEGHGEAHFVIYKDCV